MKTYFTERTKSRPFAFGSFCVCRERTNPDGMAASGSILKLTLTNNFSGGYEYNIITYIKGGTLYQNYDM